MNNHFNQYVLASSKTELAPRWLILILIARCHKSLTILSIYKITTVTKPQKTRTTQLQCKNSNRPQMIDWNLLTEIKSK